MKGTSCPVGRPTPINVTEPLIDRITLPGDRCGRAKVTDVNEMGLHRAADREDFVNMLTREAITAVAGYPPERTEGDE